MSKRYEIFVDGKWQGGSFSSEKAAKDAAELVRKNPDQVIEVAPKGAVSKSKK